MEQQPHTFGPYQCDVADFESAARCVALVQRGVGQIDVLVNNAGVPRDATLSKVGKPQSDVVLRTKLDSLVDNGRVAPYSDELGTDRGYTRSTEVKECLLRPA